MVSMLDMMLSSPRLFISFHVAFVKHKDYLHSWDKLMFAIGCKMK